MNRRRATKPAPVSEPKPATSLSQHLNLAETDEEVEAMLRYLLDEGCYPHMREYRDNLIAQGYSKIMADNCARLEDLRRRGFTEEEINENYEPDERPDETPQQKNHMRKERTLFRSSSRFKGDQRQAKSHRTPKATGEPAPIPGPPRFASEIEERIAYRIKHGYLPEEEADRDAYIAEGYGEWMAGRLARRDNLIRNGFDVDEDDFQ